MKKRWLSIFLLSLILVSVSGCVTYGNKGIDYLTEEEISKAVNKIENAKERLEDKLSDRQNLKEFTVEILDAVQNSFEYE